MIPTLSKCNLKQSRAPKIAQCSVPAVITFTNVQAAGSWRPGNSIHYQVESYFIIWLLAAGWALADCSESR